MPSILETEVLKKAVDDYNENGYAIIEDFLTADEVQAIKDETLRFVRQEAARLNPDGRLTKGEVWEDIDQNDYIAACVDGKVRVYYEPGAVDRTPTGGSGYRLKTTPEAAVCKVAHAVHNASPFFRRFVRSPKILEMFAALEYEQPTMIQTMVNFKNPRVGGEFIPHQDSQYVTTTSPQHVVGFWFALDDATKENGSVDVIPGSHRWALVRRYIRSGKPDGPRYEWTGPMPIYAQQSYVNLSAKKGSLVLINGLLVHKSEPNRTDKSRMAIVFHAYDKSKCSFVEGWLPTDCPAFEPLLAAN